jgi:hypothetical protein
VVLVLAEELNHRLEVVAEPPQLQAVRRDQGHRAARVDDGMIEMLDLAPQAFLLGRLQSEPCRSDVRGEQLDSARIHLGGGRGRGAEHALFDPGVDPQPGLVGEQALDEPATDEAWEAYGEGQ